MEKIQKDTEIQKDRDKRSRCHTWITSNGLSNFFPVLHTAMSLQCCKLRQSLCFNVSQILGYDPQISGAVDIDPFATYLSLIISFWERDSKVLMSMQNEIPPSIAVELQALCWHRHSNQQQLRTDCLIKVHMLEGPHICYLPFAPLIGEPEGSVRLVNFIKVRRRWFQQLLNS